MITISTVGEGTLLAVKAGYRTTDELGAYLGIIPKTAASRANRLVKAGLLGSRRSYDRAAGRNTVRYWIIDVPYEVIPVRRGQTHGKRKKHTYSAMGEKLYSCLDSYLYP